MIEHRTRYHFQPPSDWMNDPKLFFWKGAYHVFVQYSEASDWGLRLWGHTVSTDLIHWKWLPVALRPTPNGPDKDGCWTGSVVQAKGRFHILYTGVRPQVQCLASSKDLIRWEKYAGSPVIGENLKPKRTGGCWRDPCAWKEGKTWKLIIGADVVGAGGAAQLYASKDLIRWKYLHPLCVGEKTETGRAFECPDFFPLNGRHVLLTSCGRTYAHVGDYKRGRLAVKKISLADGGNFYAAKTLVDNKGRRILWGWVTDLLSRKERKKLGWSGVLSLPRVLSIRRDGAMGIEPVEELKKLRGKHWRFKNITLNQSETRLLKGPKGDALEIIAKFAPTGATEFGVAVYCSPDMQDRKEITCFRDTRRLMGAPLTLQKKEGLVLRIFVDRSVIEAFANGRACQTERHWRARKDALGVAVFTRSGMAKTKLRSVDVWALKSR